VMGAFVFAAQMINFSIPGTGSSGHIGGGLLLAAMLGPGGGFIALSSILLIQALFFADGGLLAFGCNAFNLGFFTNYLAYPLIFLPILRRGLTVERGWNVQHSWTVRRIWIASLLASIAGLQLGAFSVVIQTVLSGRTELPFAAFVLLMQPIHLAIGLVEGIVTATVLSFVWKARPELFTSQEAKQPSRPLRPVLAWLLVIALLTGGVLSWYASSDPDGLEWSIGKITGTADLAADSPIQKALDTWRERFALFPDYAPRASVHPDEPAGEKPPALSGEDGQTVATRLDSGTSLAGVIGGLLVLVLVALIALLAAFLKKRQRSPVQPDQRPDT